MKYDTIHIYAGTGVKSKLQRLAKRNRRSMSAEVQYLIETAYEEHNEVSNHTKHPRHPLV